MAISMRVDRCRSQLKSVSGSGAKNLGVLKSLRILLALTMPVCIACSSSEELQIERRFGFYSTWSDSETDVWTGQSAAGIRMSGTAEVVVSVALPKCAGEGAITVWLGDNKGQLGPFDTFSVDREWVEIMRLELLGTRDLFFKTETPGCRNEGDQRLLYAAIDVRSVKST